VRGRAIYAAFMLLVLAIGNDVFYPGEPPARADLYVACSLIVIGLAGDWVDTKR